MKVFEVNKVVVAALVLMVLSSCMSKPKAKHVFILSGQSNMVRLDLKESFIPAIEAKFGKENVIVVKDAASGQPIRRWHKNSKSLEGNEPKAKGDLYDSLMIKVNAAIANEKIKTVTFIWMQGERDAREKLGAVYENSLIALHTQLSNDLARTDIYFVIGRLSDFDMQNMKYPHWTKIRDIQVKVANSNPRFDWINTDDLNDGIIRQGKEIDDDLHMSESGYKIMGERFATKSIQLLEDAQ
jgi:hypothetical protein